MTEIFRRAGAGAEALAQVFRICHDDESAAFTAFEFPFDELCFDLVRVLPVELLAAARAEFRAVVVCRRHADDRPASYAGKVPDLFSFALPRVPRDDPVRAVRAAAAGGRAIFLRHAAHRKERPADGTRFLCHDLHDEAQFPGADCFTHAKDGRCAQYAASSVSLYTTVRA